MSSDTSDDTIATGNLTIEGPGVAGRDVSREIVLVDRHKGLASCPSGRTQKRVRAKTPKVRTGCQNCKIRRVKCDEGLPGCDRCFRYGIYCSGYSAAKMPHQNQQQHHWQIAQPLAPRRVLLQSRGIKVTIPKIHSGSPRFADETESRYFRYYCEEIASQITGPFKTSLWDRLIPQASDLEPFIGHAIIALGALSKARKEAKGPSLELCLHRQYALQKYVEALKGMRAAICGKTHDTRKALIACLLVFCFESLEGHQAVASVHAMSGVNLLQQWNAERGHNDGGSPIGAVVEDDEIYPAIAALDFHALCFLDHRPSSVHDQLKTDLNHSIALMPYILNQEGQFTTLRESRRYGLHMMRRTFHFISSFNNYLSRTRTLDVQEWEEEGNAHLEPGNNAWSSGPPQISPSTLPQDLVKEYHEYMADMKRWEDASATVLDKAAEVPDSEDFVAAVMMKIHARMTIVWLAGTLSPDEINCDALIEEYRSITTLSASIHSKLISGVATYNFEIGILPALLQVSSHCRNREIRDQAIELLYEGGKRGYREGIWDSGVVARIANAMRELEKPWADESGFVPADKRLTLTGVNIVLQDRRAQIICTRRHAKREADWELIDAAFSW